MNNIVPIIIKKSKGLSLSKEEINFFVNDYTNGNIKDYQASSLLMAIKINGFNEEELLNYSEALINSGDSFPLNDDLVDKHSTGGIGDKTSISLLPILAAMGLKVFKISGRGLGFTGGTVDKLESVKGFDTKLDMKSVNDMVKKIGLSLTGQTPKLTPADGLIYALRDITGTVDSLELIAASIISKKIASGAKNILIDLKIGSGAFIDSLKQAKKLAKLMKSIANHFDRNIFVLFSSMNQPLGYSIGNKNEVVEAYEALNNKWSPDFYELIKKISTELYSKSKNLSISKSEEKFNEVINNSKAANKLKEWFLESGVDNFEEAMNFNPKFKVGIKADKDGYVSFKNVKEFGNSLIEIKAGRKTKGDILDFDSGIKIFYKSGDKINKDDLLFEITSSNKIPEEVINNVKDIIIINDKKNKQKLILGELSW